MGGRDKDDVVCQLGTVDQGCHDDDGPGCHVTAYLGSFDGLQILETSPLFECFL